ncbi:trefoil factor 3-like [Anomaloglossus baeobatrachus]|uniref:trefoil factor 3-like n=1 Tax=Anomaloglossus baeobatrachus TaxID=238106 RepID=UPI003F4F7B9F
MGMDWRLCWVLALVMVLAAGGTAQAPSADHCVMDLKMRANCGYPGISAAICHNKGCCFDNKVSGIAWCFHPINSPQECVPWD